MHAALKPADTQKSVWRHYFGNIFPNYGFNVKSFGDILRELGMGKLGLLDYKELSPNYR